LAQGFLDHDGNLDYVGPGAEGRNLGVYASTRPATKYARLGNDPHAELAFGNHSLFPGAIRGTVYLDVDGNGIHDTSELPAQGVSVILDQNNNGVLDIGIDRLEVTDADGKYAFDGLAPGDYTVFVPVPAGSELTATPRAALLWHLTGQEVFVGQDFGIHFLTGTARGTKWNDLDG